VTLPTAPSDNNPLTGKVGSDERKHAAGRGRAREAARVGHGAENLTIAEHAEIAEVLAILRDGFAAEIFCAGARFAYCSEATCKPAADSKVAYCWCKLEANATEGKFQINEASATLVRSATYRRAAVAARENRTAAARELLCGALRTGDIFREAGFNTRCAIAG
jgi:hypothetical protein